MLYYNKDKNGKIEHFTTSKNLAEQQVANKAWKKFFETDEDIVMQSDNSGYVLASEYIEPVDDYVPTIEEQVQANTDAIMEIMEVLANG